MEILVSLEKTNDQTLTVDIQRIKGLKIDQKNPSLLIFLSYSHFSIYYK